MDDDIAGSDRSLCLLTAQAARQVGVRVLPLYLEAAATPAGS
jgi:hypothetical protein